jgi:hypothetical protein
MTRRTLSTLIALVAVVLAMPISAGAQAASEPAVDITLTSKPTPPTTGSNTFEVTLKDASGRPVSDADVSGSVMMAGSWDVTVGVKRGGKDVASKKLPLVAK